MDRLDDLAEVETVLGYHFGDGELLRAALIHPSAAKGKAPGMAFERLEFLGDRVLGLAIASLLYETYESDPEGQLSRRLAALVRKETCAEVMAESGLAAFLQLAGNARTNQTILGDACEAVIGALYLDGGVDPARRFVGRWWGERLRNPPERLRDAKSRLQEWSLAQASGVPSYATIEREGPDHAPIFTVEVRVGGEVGRGRGMSKREAEMRAAENVLERVTING